MVDVSSHQQLLGSSGVLKFVPGPEVAIRVFNLLRPATHFPISRGDERDIIGYYGGVDGGRDGSNRAWEGDDPYRPAVYSPEEEISQARKSELLREIHKQRQEIESKEASIAELQKKVERLNTLLEGSVTPEELQMLKDNLAKAERLANDKDEELSKLGSQCRVLEGEKRVIAQQLQAEQTRNTDLTTAHIQVQQRLQTELETRGEENSYKVVLEQERVKHSALQQQLELRLQDLERERAVQQAELEELRGQAAASVPRESVDVEAAKLRSEVSHHLSQLNTCRTDLAQAKQRVQAEATRADAEAAKCRLSEERAMKLHLDLEAAKKEILEISDKATKQSALLKEKEKEVSELKEEKLANQYSLVGQALGINPT